MAVQIEPSWESLPPETREVIEWAKACERTSKDVGTRALLIGILKAGGGRSSADVLLRHFGVHVEQLYQALQSRPRFVIDPSVATKSSLTGLPPLTLNAQQCLVRADEVRKAAAQISTDPQCLFGALLERSGTARAGLKHVLAGVSLGEVATHYLNWLVAGTGSYAEALAKRFPIEVPTASSFAPPNEPHLVALLRRQTQDGSPYRIAGLSVVIGDSLLLTTVEPAAADRVLLATAEVHTLEWIAAGGGLAAARLNPPLSRFSSMPLMTGPSPGAQLRCYAVSDDGSDLRTLAVRASQPSRSEDWFFDLASNAAAGYSLIGSPIFDEHDRVIGLIEGGGAKALQVISTAAVEEFLIALGHPGRADVPAASVMTIGNASGADNDRVAKTDQLGFQVYVKAFADLIRSEHTEPPLTIGIFGSWGMGKSFLLEHITQEIERQQESNSSGPRIHQVCFNAWEYLASEAIWPALVRKIVTELDRLRSWPRHKRVLTRLWWNLRRKSRSLRTRLVTAGLVLAFTVAFAVGKHGLALGLGGLTALLGLGSLIKAANDPVGKWVTDLFAGSDYGGQIDVMAEIKHDLEELERRLHVDGDRTDRVLVVIDDLDRCEPAKAVEVLQAVNQLLSFPSFIVCLGIDARIITAAVEKHYEGLLGVAGASGYEYLDKIVQIPFRIPEPGADEITAFIQSQLAVRSDTAAVAGSSDDSAEAELSDIRPQAGTWTAAAQLDAESERLWPNSEAPAPLPSLPSPQVLFTMDEQRAFELFVPYLRPNPRHLKRLINVYRLVRSLGLAEGERLVLDRPAAVLRWLIMWAQWPLTSSMLLRRLDSAGIDDGAAADPMLSLLDQVERSIDPKARADRDDDPRKLRGLLAVSGCALSVDEIRRIRRYTVNFNPAIEEQLRGSDGHPSEVPEPA